MKWGFACVAVLRYSPQQIEICIRTLLENITALEALTAGLQAYLPWGRADGKWKYIAKKTSSLSLPSSLHWSLITGSQGMSWKLLETEQIFGLAHWLNFGREGKLHQDSQVGEKVSANQHALESGAHICNVESTGMVEGRRKDWEQHSVETTDITGFFTPISFSLLSDQLLPSIPIIVLHIICGKLESSLDQWW